MVGAAHEKYRFESIIISPAVLYKQGPRYYHASYVVLVVDAAAASSSTAALSSRDLQGHYRIAEASKKVTLKWTKMFFFIIFSHFSSGLVNR